jgi:osmotically inducible protein OsmC
MIRRAVAVWNGGPASGEGSVSTSSGVIENVLYSFGSGNGDEPCTSPTEMLAAAVASCISVMIVREMARAGLRDKYVRTESELTVEENKGQWDITGIELNVIATVPEIHAAKFRHIAEAAKAKCPISRTLKVPIKMTVKEELETKLATG